jgi:hypothetical protein
VICGRVVDQGSGIGIAGAIVEAFDTDLFEDDALGTSLPSGADGHFRIDCTAADFRHTPFSPLINVEFFPGPDLYFRVASAGGGVLLQGDRSLGRSPGRGNVASHIDLLTGRTSAIPRSSSHRNNLAFHNNLQLRGVVPWRDCMSPIMGRFSAWGSRSSAAQGWGANPSTTA